jgi:HAD superfamily hydrolase (TIGR01509 family)
VPLAAIILDFDGTILDTETPEVRAWQRIFRSHGAEFPDEYWMHAIGRGADQIDKTPIDLLEELADFAPDRAEVLRTYDRLRMSDILASEVRPGIRELIQAAAEARIPLAVASSSHHFWVDRHLQRLELLSALDCVVCADDVPRAKPFPDLYVEACRRLNAPPELCVAIEDSPNGIAAAKSAGLKCVAIPNPCTERLNLSGADIILGSASEATLEVLEQLLVH